MYYLCADEDAADAAEAEIFAAFCDQVAATDPEAIAEDGTIIARNAVTGELAPDAGRTTGYYGPPQRCVGGWFYPVPEDPALQVEALTLKLHAVELVESVIPLNPAPPPH
jgi:hypothetical protein